jgi:hypothetical protein
MCRTAFASASDLVLAAAALLLASGVPIPLQVSLVAMTSSPLPLSYS